MQAGTDRITYFLDGEDARTFHSAGISAEALLHAAAEVLRQTGLRTLAPARGLSSAEEAFLRAAGAKGVGDIANDAVARNVARVSEEYDALLRAAMSGRQIAELLGVTPGRISQRAAQCSLYTMSGRGGAVVYPAFQVCGDRLLPGLEQVIVAIPLGANPVAVARFFRVPHPDLATSNGVLSPREWLLAGNDPHIIADLASDIAGII